MTIREQLKQNAELVMSIESCQKDHPGYAQQVLEKVVGSELRRLVAEQKRFDAAHVELASPAEIHEALRIRKRIGGWK